MHNRLFPCMHGCTCICTQLAMPAARQAHPLAAPGSVTSSGPRSSPPPGASLGYGSPGCTAGEAARARFPEPPGGLLHGAVLRGTSGVSITLGCAHSAVADMATRSGMPATYRRSKVRSPSAACV